MTSSYGSGDGLVKAVVIAGLMFYSGAFIYATINNNEIKNNLSSKAIPNVKSINEAFYYHDVNNDGKYESVFSFKNPTTGFYEHRLVEFDGNNLCFKKFNVENSKIKYSDSLDSLINK
mgnify:CR=1 FL=1